MLELYTYLSACTRSMLGLQIYGHPPHHHGKSGFYRLHSHFLPTYRRCFHCRTKCSLARLPLSGREQRLRALKDAEAFDNQRVAFPSVGLRLQMNLILCWYKPVSSECHCPIVFGRQIIGRHGPSRGAGSGRRVSKQKMNGGPDCGRV